MLRYAMYPLVALTFVATKATAQAEPAETTCCSTYPAASEARDSAIARESRKRIMAGKPRSAAEQARAESTMAAIKVTLDSLGSLAKKDSVAGQ
jgi:hypothetical protein